MDIKKEYGVSEDLSENGVWLPFDDDTDVLIGRFGSASYENEVEKLTKPHFKVLKQKGASGFKRRKQLYKEINCRAMAKTILLGWKNLKEDGIDVPYSADTAYEMLMKYTIFREEIAELAADNQNFFEDDVKEIEENLE